MKINYKETLLTVLLVVIVDTILDETGVQNWIEQTTRDIIRGSNEA